MSIIQDIRDKYARLTVILVAIALVGFILTDYFAGQSRAGGRVTSGVGSVNGRDINFDVFNQKVTQTEDNMKSQGYPQGAGLTQQALEQAWNQQVSTMLLEEEFSKLGIEVGKKELGDILYGENAPQDLQSQFKDEKTGLYNAALAKQNIDQILKKGTQAQKDNLADYFNQLANVRMADKYFSLMSNSINYPRWFIEKQNAENSQLAKVSYVKETYSSIADSTVKVSDEEIKEYINKHKSQFKQVESRGIYYVTFSAAPSTSDSAAALSQISNKIESFRNTTDIEQYLAGEGAPFYNGYINANAIKQPMKDSIFRTPVGQIYGPYLDAGSYVLAKMLGVTSMADTAKVRHILISTQNRDSATAYNLCDSIRKAIAGGSNFDSLVMKFSDDTGSKEKGGVYDNITSGQMVAPFNDFCFMQPVGAKGIVKTEFGFHYIEVLSQKGRGAGYKVAYLPLEITASQETDNQALNKANEFAGDSKDLASFESNFEKNLKSKGYVKGVATDITPVAYEIRGVGASRSLVRSIYEADKGDVLKPERVDNSYVVAVITNINEEGTASVDNARASVEPILRNKKKADILKKKIGTVSSLEAAATALGGKTIETADSIRIVIGPGSALGYEPRVTGAAFNPANKGKLISEPIEGMSGVFVVRVDAVETTPVTDGDIATQREARYQQARQQMSSQYNQNNPVSILRNAATIKDKRATRY
jgi:peptidyl-prolyl cis-trans isomerase D